MSYYFAKTLDLGFDEAVERAKSVLKESGFGVLTEIDMQATLKEKIGADMPAYRILGACNPPLAHKAVTAEPHIGLMLPCNVIVRATEDGKVEVAAVDPLASMMAVENEGLGAVATQVHQMLKDVVAAL